MIKVLESSEILQRLRARRATDLGYLAMYSTWWQGIVRDPALMMVPIDDHMVHRGDGVFEAFKSVGKKLYLLDAHLARLQVSAEQLYLGKPVLPVPLKDLVVHVARTVGEPDLSFRLYWGRGPGGFSANPYDSKEAQIYIVATRYKAMPASSYEHGVKVGLSTITAKAPFFARIKSLNYLPNVLMKKEAVDKGFDCTITTNERGELGEGATENLAFINASGQLCYPELHYVLRGTTLMRLGELAKRQGLDVVEQATQRRDLERAREIFLVGTTLDVLPVTSYDGQPVGDGKVGPLARQLRGLLQADMLGSEVTTSYE